MKTYKLPFYGFFYRLIMRVAHRFNWHYAPPIYPDGDTILWCKWCGLRYKSKSVFIKATEEYLKESADTLSRLYKEAT